MAANDEVIFMEEEQEHSSRRKVIRKEVHRGTCVSNPPTCISDELSIIIQPNTPSDPCTKTEDEWLQFFENGSFSDTLEKPKIQRVPPMLRDIELNKKCYDPVVVSIGPFHHGKPDLAPMERFKFLLTRMYAKESKVSVKELYKKVAEVSGEARKCYTEDSTADFDEEVFARMMFLDGCFLLQFVSCIAEGNDKRKEMEMKSRDISFVKRDLLLLENQLPFKVLKVLMNERFEEGKGEETISNFIKRYWPKSRINGELETDKENKCIEKFKKFFNFFSTADDPEEKDYNSQPVHLLELVRSQLIDVKAFERGGYYPSGEYWYSYRSAMELKKVGIHFKPGKSTRYSDIKFKSKGFSSVLTLPPITIDDLTESMLLNLVAYEACPDTPDDFGVTSYICFMDSIIDHGEDVKVLRSTRILQNCSGSDEEVAKLFNAIAKDLVPNPYGFSDVKSGIEKHYKSVVKVWMAECKHAHFSSPWTVVAFFAAIFVISLSVIQTVLAAIQTRLTAIQTHLTAHPP
ncbi:hypothetical protein LguiB_004232 [Lonicera macranthoides]